MGGRQMAGETHKIDWIADISIETDYIVGLHDGCGCRRVGKDAEWLFEFWFGSEILTANIDFAPYATKKWAVDEINKVIAIVNAQTDEKLSVLRSELKPLIDANRNDIDGLARRVSKNEADISLLKAEDIKLWNAINNRNSLYDSKISSLESKDIELKVIIDRNTSSCTRLDTRVSSIETKLNGYPPIATPYSLGMVKIGSGLGVSDDGTIYTIGGSSGGGSDGGNSGDSSDQGGQAANLGSVGSTVLPVYSENNKLKTITGLILPDGTVQAKVFKIGNVEMTTDASGNVVIKGNAYTTGWFAAGGIGQPGDSGGNSVGDKVASATTLGMIKVGNGLEMSNDQSGTLNANLGPGLKFDSYGRITVNIGEGGGLEIDSNGVLKQTGTNPTPSDPYDTVVGLTWDDLAASGSQKINASHIDYDDDTMEIYQGKLSVKYASKTTYGAVMIGSGLSVSNGVISVTNTGGGGDGTVTSVGLSMPSEFSVSPSSITSSGTFDVTLKNNYVIPTSSQVELWDKICNLFDVDSHGDVYVKDSRGLYSYSFISAGGR